MSEKKLTVREIALNILENVEKNQSYSNLVLNNVIKTNELSSRDAALLTEITYGTIQRKMTIDYYLEPFVKGKLQSWVRNLLRLTVYQLVFLDRIPTHAAIYEAVEIGKKRGHSGVARLINGVLRSFERTELRSLELIKNNLERLAIETSHPKWLVKQWVEQYGYEKTQLMCRANLNAPTQTARVNTALTTVETCLQLLREEAYDVEQSQLIPEGIRSLKGNVAHSNCYKNGFLTIQDESSMLVAYALAPKRNDIVLDACAAPGGKSTHIAEKLMNSGQVIALDIHKHKIKLVNAQADRLQLTNIETSILDSRNASEHYGTKMFNKILLDAPCSGLGVVRRKPDVKYTKDNSDLLKLQQVQLELLEQVAMLLKDDGTLVYSTCTVNKLENEDVIKQFLSIHNEFELDDMMKDRMPDFVKEKVSNGMMQLFPDDFETDGFFIACLRKKGN